MNLGPAINTWLSQDTTINDIVEGRIFADHLPQSLLVPAIVYSIVSSEPEDLLDGRLELEPAVVQIDCFALSQEQSTDLWELVRTRILAAAYQIIDGLELKEVSQARGMFWAAERQASGTDQRRFVCSQDFSFWYCS